MNLNLPFIIYFICSLCILFFYFNDSAVFGIILALFNFNILLQFIYCVSHYISQQGFLVSVLDVRITYLTLMVRVSILPIHMEYRNVTKSYQYVGPFILASLYYIYLFGVNYLYESIILCLLTNFRTFNHDLLQASFAAWLYFLSSGMPITQNKC